MNFLIRTPAGSLIIEEKNAPELVRKPKDGQLLCAQSGKHVLIIKLMMPTASYKLEDSGSKNPHRELSVFIICLFLCICRIVKDFPGSTVFEIQYKIKIFLKKINVVRFASKNETFWIIFKHCEDVI